MRNLDSLLADLRQGGDFPPPAPAQRAHGKQRMLQSFAALHPVFWIDFDSQSQRIGQSQTRADKALNEGLAAAAAVGDDRIQRMSGRSVNPDGFTHGSAQERAAWFKRGFDSGKVSSCDTFNR